MKNVNYFVDDAKKQDEFRAHTSSKTSSIDDLVKKCCIMT